MTVVAKSSLCICRRQALSAWAHLVIAVEPEGDASHLSGGHLPGGYGRHDFPYPIAELLYRETLCIRCGSSDVCSSTALLRRRPPEAVLFLHSQ